MTTLIFVASFLFLAFAANQIGQLATTLRLPLITGYLLAGAVAGPFVLDLISKNALDHLKFIDEMALAYIAFAAGSELYLSELRSRFKSIVWVTAGSVVFPFVFGVTALFLIADWVPFMEEMSGSERLAIGLMGGAIMVARSPSSAIAIVNELRAKGPFTKTVLGVTVVTDIVVIILFAEAVSFADTLLTGVGISFASIELLGFELLLAFVLGYVVGQILKLILRLKIDMYFKAGLILLTGLSIFVFTVELRHYTHENLPYEIFLEPLLIAMIGSFVVVNYTPHRAEFTEILEKIGGPIIVLFFTLTGASLALDLLIVILPIALILFVVRVLAIGIGAVIGGTLAGDELRYNQMSWMAYITQAGVGLGLAKEVADEFPEFGAGFATLIISVIVLSQIVGPPFFKFAIKRLNEAHLPGIAQPDAIRDVLILGVNTQSLTLARQLHSHSWQVTLADMDTMIIERAQRALDTNGQSEIRLHHLQALTEKDLSAVITSATDAIVAMLPHDADNYQACELAYEKFGVPRQIAQINEPSWSKQFQTLGVRVVDPTSAMVNVLDQCVRSPQSAELLLGEESEYDTVQVTITDRDVVGLSLRELVLPDDVLVLGIRRREQWIMPHGHTTLRWNDEVTFIGKPLSLVEITRRFGY